MTFKVGIAISNPLPLYTCGDQIKGAIYVKSENGILVQRLLVQLLCKVFTRSKGKDAWPGVNRLGDQQTVSIPYCFIKRIITQPRLINTTEPLEFEFTIPAETVRNEVEPRWQPSTTFEQFSGHAVPPTWRDRYGRAEVLHGLEVVMETGGVYEGKKAIVGREITFAPCRAVEFPDARCVPIARTLQVKLPKEFMAQNVALRRSKSIMKHLLSSDENKSTAIYVHMHCPTVLHAGGSIPVSISIQLDHISNLGRPFTPSHDSPPESSGLGSFVFVEGVYVYLALRTSRRIQIGTSEHTLFEDDQISVCNVLDRPVAIGASPVPLNLHYPEVKLQPEIAPSFKCFSIRRTFELHIRVRLVVGDQQHTINLQTPVLVLPAIFRNTAGAIRDAGDRTSLRRRVSEETLPSYAETDPLAEGPLPMVWERPPPLVM